MNAIPRLGFKTRGSGASISEKLQKLQDNLKKAGMQRFRMASFAVTKQFRSAGAHALVVSALDEVAWLFNLRGADIEFNPVFYSYALITPEGLTL